MSRELDVAHCEALIRRQAAGDRQASHALVQYLWPFWTEYVQSCRSMGPLARSDDHVRNVVTRLVAKVSLPDSEHATQYLNWRLREPTKTFEDWTRIVVANQVRDYAREILGGRSETNDQPSAKRLLNEFFIVGKTVDSSMRPPFTAIETARELMEFARMRLPNDQLTALGIWLEGASYEDVEQQLGIPVGNGKRLVRAAVAVLRRQFAERVSDDEQRA